MKDKFNHLLRHILLRPTSAPMTGEEANLVGSTGAMGGTGCYHVEIAFGAWAVQLVIGQRSDDDAR